jgi:hypothetical protein
MAITALLARIFIDILFYLTVEACGTFLQLMLLYYSNVLPCLLVKVNFIIVFGNHLTCDFAF